MTSLAAAAREAFTAVRETHPGEKFYYFALYTTDDGGYVVPTSASEESLAEVVARYRGFDARPDSDLRASLRFSAADSPYHCVEEELFQGYPRGPALHEACFGALAQLDAEGFFGRDGAREAVLVNVAYGDMSDERWLAHAERLNPPAAVARVLQFVAPRAPSGPVARWAANARSITALSLSADRRTVAYSGPGGDLGVYLVGTRECRLSRARGGEFWASVVSRDGARLYLGDRERIDTLSVKTGRRTLFAGAEKPSVLALAPDGSRLAASSFAGPVRAFDTRSRLPMWSFRTTAPSALAFSPCGERLAVGSCGIVSLVDSETGAVSWSCDVGDVGGVAWTPDGTSIVVTVACASSRGVHGLVVRISAADGSIERELPLDEAAGALAISPGGELLALCVDDLLVVLDWDGTVVASGAGGQESLNCCVFADSDTVLAVGSDVNGGAAMLQLSLPRVPPNTASNL